MPILSLPWKSPMWIFTFYRTYVALCAGTAEYLFLKKSAWLLIATAVMVRCAWFAVEQFIGRMIIKRDFNRHVYEFKQQLGPYGIRMANKADSEWRIKKSLAEVFTSNTARLRKNVEQLQMMDTLFKAGMSPDAETYQLHDCKLKYGVYRTDRLSKSKKL
jgi:hypothetical protein